MSRILNFQSPRLRSVSIALRGKCRRTRLTFALVVLYHSNIPLHRSLDRASFDVIERDIAERIVPLGVEGEAAVAAIRQIGE
jgi:hypothetical protein